MHPQLLARFADALLSSAWSRAQLEELLYHAYGSPWLQALLTALAGQGCAPFHLMDPWLSDCPGMLFWQCGSSCNICLALAERDSTCLDNVPSRAILARLVPRLLGGPERDRTAEQGEELGEAEEGGLLEGIPVAHVHGMMQERTSSHVMEVRWRTPSLGALWELHLACCTFPGLCATRARPVHGKKKEELPGLEILKLCYLLQADCTCCASNAPGGAACTLPARLAASACLAPGGQFCGASLTGRAE